MADVLGQLNDGIWLNEFLGSSRFVISGVGDASLRRTGATGVTPNFLKVVQLRSYRYYRFNILSMQLVTTAGHPSANSDFVGLGEWVLAMNGITNLMTTPGNLSSSDEEPPSTDDFAVDGSLTGVSGDSWVAATAGGLPQWIQYDFGTPTAINVMGITGYRGQHVSAAWRSVKDWRLEGSDNGSDFEVVAEGTEDPWTDAELGNPMVIRYKELSLAGDAPDCGLRDVTDFDDRTQSLFIHEDTLGKEDERFDLGDVWFDLFIVVPDSIAFGNILSDQEITISVYSSYRNQNISLNEVNNHLGPGTILSGIPSLPFTMEPQTGFLATFQVFTTGQPNLNNTIDFISSVSTEVVEVTGTRIVMFALRPEVPLVERLDFITDVLTGIDGTEQRVALRKNPRQTFEFNMQLDGEDRQFLENLMYDWQSRVFGIPVWFEPSFLTAAATASDLTVNVDDTTLADFRVGGLAIVLNSRSIFDALEVESITGTSITFTSGLNNSYPVGTQVLPVRIAKASQSIRGSRGPVADKTDNIVFEILNNDVGDSFGSASAFSTLNSKVFLDDPNFIDGQLSEKLESKQIIFDNRTGIQSVSSPWSRSKRSSSKGFITHDRTELWNMRKLVHAMRGRQTSFYIPTFYDDITPTSALLNATSTITTANVGFSRFAQYRAPSKAIIRVHRTNGSILKRDIIGATEVSNLVEQITVDSPWPSDIALDEIVRIEFVELVRFDTDQFRITHTDALGQARLSVPIKAVFE